MIKQISTYAETVKFTGDLSTPFEAGLIDKLRVYNLSSRKFSMCEEWGSDEKYLSFGLIADFDYTITYKGIRFYFGDPPQWGYFEKEPERLVLLKRGKGVPRRFVPTGSADIDKTFPVPKTMFELAECIDDFINHYTTRFIMLRQEHRAHCSNRKSQAVKDQDSDDLPF